MEEVVGEGEIVEEVEEAGRGVVEEEEEEEDEEGGGEEGFGEVILAEIEFPAESNGFGLGSTGGPNFHFSLSVSPR